MAKKIYDIKPPKLAHKKDKDQSGPVAITRRKKPAHEAPAIHHTRNKKEGRSVWVPISICGGVFVLCVCVYLFFKLPKADIAIWPKVDTLSFTQAITADKSADSINISKNIIPAQYFQSTKTNAQDFPATGNASNVGQATGSITIYNKFDPPTPFTFKAGTHFMSDSGKLFVALQKVVIPAAKKTGSKITPGSVKINVQAVEGGNDYNIAPSNFSIPGLKGTPYYYSIYATSVSAMAGGYTGAVKKVTDDDIQGAKDVLTQKSTADAIADLKSQIPDGYVLLDNAIMSNTTAATTPVKAGAIAESFNYKVTVAASALAFKKSDIEQFAKNYIISKLPAGKTLLDNSFKINYSASVVDVSGGKATISADFSSGEYQSIDKNSVSMSLMGQNAEQINSTIKNSLGEQVSKIKINFWPFWVVSAPNSQKAVNVVLRFQ